MILRVVAYAALSIAVAALAMTNHGDAAAAVALSAYTGLAATLHRSVRHVQDSIGPANGTNLRELLERVVALETYQHDRNHKIVNALTPSNARISLEINELRKLLERIAPPPSTEGT